MRACVRTCTNQPGVCMPATCTDVCAPNPSSEQLYTTHAYNVLTMSSRHPLQKITILPWCSALLFCRAKLTDLVLSVYRT